MNVVVLKSIYLFGSERNNLFVKHSNGIVSAWLYYYHSICAVYFSVFSVDSFFSLMQCKKHTHTPRAQSQASVFNFIIFIWPFFFSAHSTFFSFHSLPFAGSCSFSRFSFRSPKYKNQSFFLDALRSHHFFRIGWCRALLYTYFRCEFEWCLICDALRRIALIKYCFGKCI